MDQATVKPSVVCLVQGFNVLREKMRYYKLRLRRRKSIKTLQTQLRLR